jgi:conjugative transfer signal peptidase TraF
MRQSHKIRSNTLKRKFAVLYTLITSLCFVALAFIIFHALGYRVNRSESLPFFIYKITPLAQNEEIRSGDCVVIDLSKVSNPVIERGMERGYVVEMFHQPMLKRIGAVPGDTVALEDNSITVNGETTPLHIASQDSYGGELSAWPTPITLSFGQYWLDSNPERGFDSRYFGPIDRSAFTHTAKPLF